MRVIKLIIFFIFVNFLIIALFGICVHDTLNTLRRTKSKALHSILSKSKRKEIKQTMLGSSRQNKNFVAAYTCWASFTPSRQDVDRATLCHFCTVCVCAWRACVHRHACVCVRAAPTSSPVPLCTSENM